MKNFFMAAIMTWLLAVPVQQAEAQTKLWGDIEYDGKRKTYKQYAEEFGVSEKTIKRYMSEWEEDI